MGCVFLEDQSVGRLHELLGSASGIAVNFGRQRFGLYQPVRFTWRFTFDGESFQASRGSASGSRAMIAIFEDPGPSVGLCAVKFEALVDLFREIACRPEVAVILVKPELLDFLSAFESRGNICRYKSIARQYTLVTFQTSERCSGNHGSRATYRARDCSPAKRGET